MKTTTIHQEILINAAPDDVYDAFVSAAKHAKFTGSKATSDPRVNGKFTSWDGYAFGKYTELVKGEKIVEEWSTTEWPENAEPSVLELTLAPSKGGTLLKMAHSKVPVEQSNDYAEGWKEFYWKPMKSYFSKLK